MLHNLITCPKHWPEQKFNVHHPSVMHHIATSITKIAYPALENHQDIVVLCIGSDRSTGDSLGPLTGTKLQTLSPHINVLGTLDEPVHATNLADVIEHITLSFTNPFIIAVDACLGKLDSVGCVALGYGSVKPGAAVHKELPPVGDAYITGVVNIGGFMEHMVLQSTRLNLVIKMADAIAYGLSSGLMSAGK